MSLQAALEQALAGSSPLVVPLVFLGGAATSLNPCVYPTIPVIIGFVSGQKAGGPEVGKTKARGLALALTFVVGLAITYVILGATASFVGSVLGLSKAGWNYVVAGVCVVVGLAMAGVLPLDFATWAPAQSKWSRMSGFAGALGLGMLFGLVASPCAVPVLALIVALIASKGQVAYGSVLMFFYALGHGLPLVILGTVTGALTGLERFTKYSVAFQRVGGWLLVGVAGYLIWTA
jgi:cytochrome c-type biogenesis protein